MIACTTRLSSPSIASAQLPFPGNDVSNLPRRIVKNGLTSDFYDAPGGRYWQRMSSNGQIVRDTISLDKKFEREVVGSTASVERYYVAGQLLTIVIPPKPTAVKSGTYNSKLGLRYR